MCEHRHDTIIFDLSFTSPALPKPGRCLIVLYSRRLISILQKFSPLSFDLHAADPHIAARINSAAGNARKSILKRLIWYFPRARFNPPECSVSVILVEFYPL